MATPIRTDARLRRWGALARQILEMPAKTLAGVRIRAMTLAEMLEEELPEDAATDERMIQALIRDLLAVELV